MKLKFLAALLPLLYASAAQAITPFVVKDIRVEGIQRTEAGTVFSYLPVKVGDTLDDKKSATAIRALFATGFFKDVRLEVEHGVLVVLVRERPAIASVTLNGIKEFPKDQLNSTLKMVGLTEGRILDKSALDKSVQELKRQYVSRGKYGVSVKARTVELERNRVAVYLDVKEGNVSKIHHINFVGNQSYSDDELMDQIKLTSTNWLSWFAKDDQYSKQKLSGDLESLRSFYMDNGHMEFNINSTQVSISPDKKDIYITINITEGPRYTISDIKIVGGEKVLPHERVREMLTFKTGDTFSRKEVTAFNQKMAEQLGDLGYAFANVNLSPELDKDKHTASFTVIIDPGQRIYVRRINISGNEKTRDEVIRREFRQMESAWFATSKTKKSKQRVDKLDFFSSVNIETPQVQGTPDQLDIDIAVKEKSTGSFTVGAGVSSGEGLILSGGITQSNIFGSGNYLSTQLNTSKINQIYSVSYTNPYYTEDGISRGFDIYKKGLRTSNSAVMARYLSDTLGAGVRLGIPINDENSWQYGLNVERASFSTTTLTPQRFIDYINRVGSTNTNYTATIGWKHDSRDSAIYTTDGVVHNAYVEASIPASDQKFYRLTYQQQRFFPLAQDITLMLNGELGYAASYGNLELPFFKYFFGGGIGSVRGYRPGSLGPQDATGYATGGDRRVVGNIEVLFPVPGQGRDKSFRMSTFLDAGAIYGPTGQGITAGADGMRYSTGIAVAWLSPMGPLKFSLGFPLNKQPSDKLQTFQFTLGSLF